MKISVVINTFNAEKHLERVLDYVKEFDEIVICDMHSTDRTLDIAHKFKCTIVHHEKTGVVEPARNFAIQSAAHEWVLVIDADEIVPKELRNYLYEQISQPECPKGIRIPMKNYFMGHLMRAAYPSYLLRFFKKDSVNWPPAVHSQPEINGQIYNIPSHRKDLAFIHLANDSVQTNIRKTNTYTEQEIEKRRKKKYGFFTIIYEPFFRFFKFYIIKGGFLDGKAGLIYASLNAFYKFTTIAKIWESTLQEKDMDQDLLK